MIRVKSRSTLCQLTDGVSIPLAEDASVEGWFPVAGFSGAAESQNDQRHQNQRSDQFEASHIDENYVGRDDTTL